MIVTLEQRLVYENDYVRVYDDRVAFPDGHEGTYYHSRWKAPYGVAVVPIADHRVLLLRCYRYGDGRDSLEIPSGFGVEGREPSEQAAEELRQETGLEAEGLKELMVLGGAYQTHVYSARVPTTACPSSAQQEPTESISGFEWVTAEELDAAGLMARGVYHPITVASLLAVRPLL